MGDARILDRLLSGATPREVALEMGVRLSRVLNVQATMKSARKSGTGRRKQLP